MRNFARIFNLVKRPKILAKFTKILAKKTKNPGKKLYQITSSSWGYENDSDIANIFTFFTAITANTFWHLRMLHWKLNEFQNANLKTFWVWKYSWRQPRFENTELMTFWIWEYCIEDFPNLKMLSWRHSEFESPAMPMTYMCLFFVLKMCN